MSGKSYKNIKKYAAFIFMVFTVLSGSSDRIDSDNYVKVGKKALVDIIGTNKLFAQDLRVSASQLRSRTAIEDDEDLSVFLDTFGEDSHLNNIWVYTIPLIIFIICINNLLLKNSIWKNAVF